MDDDTAIRLFQSFGRSNPATDYELAVANPACVCEMAAILKLSQPLLFRRLAYLRNSGLVIGSRHRLRITYQLNEKHPLLPQIRHFLEQALRNEPGGQIDLHNLNAECRMPKDEIQ
ncbi:MAG: ArsR family transcriptional regulator [Bryobacteraceae bacterium]